ncbi:unnamed protein product [Linum tenue]|uniref:Uncharacterized protein n=1 Tax=Linum tenue TaxID=586396 RepID=A0AAV0K975_9ROSI|nr:unnamed protein product [Linum tenue]
MALKEAGGSLPVPNVQQLASSSNDVPIRYIRPELELERVSSDDEYVQVPVIDMSKLDDGDDDDDVELAKLHSACRDWGFFQVINHGVANTMMMKMNADIQEFFNQSLHEKMECAQLPNTIEGYGQAFVVSEEQKLDWGDMLFIIARPLDGRNMNIWPKVPSSFRATLDQYSTELEKLTSSLLSSMARNLGLEPGKLLSLFKEGMQGMRMNYYPPCAFIVNVGDIIEIMSNGEYKSIEHRAVVNPEKERLSIATFHSPNFSATIGPLSNLLTKDKKGQAPNYKSISHEDYLKLGAKIKLDGKGKGLIHQMKIQPEALNGEK